MLAVRLPDDLEYELRRMTETSRRTKSDIVKEALTLFFKMQRSQKKKTSYELGKELFGRYESGRCDLSVNYKKEIKGRVGEKYGTRR